MAQSSTERPSEETPRHGRRRVAGIALAALALGASLVYALRPHSSTPVADAQAPLGALTNTDPGIGYLSTFNHQGWTDRIGNKPALVFAGTDTCPYCEVERWAVVKALSAFGRWSGLAKSGLMPTFDLTASRFQSPYVAFKYTAMEDLKLTQREAHEMLNTNPSGGTLWILVADRNTGNTGLDPNLINGMSFGSIQKQLRSGSPGAGVPGSLTHEINSEANALIAILCHANGMQPQTVCGRTVIRHAVASLSS